MTVRMLCWVEVQVEKPQLPFDTYVRLANKKLAKFREEVLPRVNFGITISGVKEDDLVEILTC